MKAGRQPLKSNAARARNIRGKDYGKGKDQSGENENTYGKPGKFDRVIEDNSKQSSLQKLHAKIQNEIYQQEDKTYDDSKKDKSPKFSKQESEMPSIEDNSGVLDPKLARSLSGDPPAISTQKKAELESEGFRFEIADPNTLGALRQGSDGFYYATMGQRLNTNGEVVDHEVRVFTASVPTGSAILYWVQYPHFVYEPDESIPAEIELQDEAVKSPLNNVNQGMEKIDYQIAEDKQRLVAQGYSHFDVTIFIEHNIIGPEKKANEYVEKLFNEGYTPPDNSEYSVIVTPGFIDDTNNTHPRVIITYMIIAQKTKKVPIYDYPVPN